MLSDLSQVTESEDQNKGVLALCTWVDKHDLLISVFYYFRLFFFLSSEMCCFDKEKELSSVYFKMAHGDLLYFSVVAGWFG